MIKKVRVTVSWILNWVWKILGRCEEAVGKFVDDWFPDALDNSIDEATEDICNTDESCNQSNQNFLRDAMEDCNIQCKEEYNEMSDWLKQEEKINSTMDILKAKCDNDEGNTMECRSLIEEYYPQLVKFTADRFIKSEIAPGFCEEERDCGRTGRTCK